MEKQVPDARSIDFVIKEVKNYWPNSQITKKNLLNPTTDFVLQFYKNFITEFYDKMAYLTKSEPNVCEPQQLASFGPEVHTYYHMVNILKNINVVFTLRDVYSPTSVRTKNIFLMCSHYINYIDSLLENHNFDDVFQKVDDLKAMEEEKANIINTFNEVEKEIYQNDTSELNAMCETLEQKITELEAKKRTKQKIIEQKTMAANTLKQDIEKFKYQLEKVTSQEQALSAQIVDPEELMLKEKELEDLESQELQLEKVGQDFRETLTDQKNTLAHLQKSQSALNQLKMTPSRKDTIKGLLEKQEKMEEECAKLEDQLKLLRVQESQTKAKHHRLRQEEESANTMYLQEKNRFEDEQASLEKYLGERTKDWQRKKADKTVELRLLTIDIQEIENKIALVKSKFTEHYNKILKAERTAGTRLNKLQNIYKSHFS